MLNKINIPVSAETILNILLKNNYKAYVCGGYVRDSLLNKAPKDCDITTDANPQEVLKLFNNEGFKTLETGLKHGTVCVVYNNENIKEIIEITTFRTESTYSNSRHPDVVKFVSDLKEDMSRRDFTMNALAYNHHEGLIDFFGGCEDIQNKIIRTVGNADKRFKEDALRMLRAIRFCSKLRKFTIEKDTFEAILRNVALLDKISAERIREEFNQIILNNGLNILKKSNILKHLFPEFNTCFDCQQNHPAHFTDVGSHSIIATEGITEQILHLKLTMFLHDTGKPSTKTTSDTGIDHFYGHAKESCIIAEKILKRLKYDNNTINKISTLIKYHDSNIQSSHIAVKRLLNKIGENLFRDLLLVKKADAYAQKYLFGTEKRATIGEIEQILNEVLSENQAFSLKDLDINGNDLINIGIKQGKEIGIVLKHLLKLVINDNSLNTKTQLLKLTKQYLENI